MVDEGDATQKIHKNKTIKKIWCRLSGHKVTRQLPVSQASLIGHGLGRRCTDLSFPGLLPGHESSLGFFKLKAAWAHQLAVPKPGGRHKDCPFLTGQHLHGRICISQGFLLLDCSLMLLERSLSSHGSCLGHFCRLLSCPSLYQWRPLVDGTGLAHLLVQLSTNESHHQHLLVFCTNWCFLHLRGKLHCQGVQVECDSILDVRNGLADLSGLHNEIRHPKLIFWNTLV